MMSLQCARAVAALLVVYYHAALIARQIGGASDWDPPIVGKFGVDIFFVLSGYIIWTSTRHSSPSPAAFFSRRLLRIAPLYWVLTTLTASVAIAAPSLLNSTKLQLNHYLASLLFIPWPNPGLSGSITEVMTPLIVPGWTLNFEMMFYTLFALVLWCERFLKLTCGTHRAIITAGVFGTVISLFYVFQGYNRWIDFYDPLLIMEFALGIFIAVLYENDYRIPLKVATAILLCGSLALIGLEALHLPVHRFTIAGPAAVAILASALAIEEHRRWPHLPWLVTLGNASFSIYLTHGFVLAGLRILDRRLFGLMQGALAEWLYCAAGLILSILGGLLCYRILEVPMSRWLKHQFPLDVATRWKRTIGSVATSFRS